MRRQAVSKSGEILRVKLSKTSTSVGDKDPKTREDEDTLSGVRLDQPRNAFSQRVAIKGRGSPRGHIPDSPPKEWTDSENENSNNQLQKQAAMYILDNTRYQ